MNEIPDLKDDLAFLKKFNSRNKVWEELDAPIASEKEKLRSNFLLHPKRFSSDSDCSSVNTPRKFFSATIFRNFSLHESNNNVQTRVRHTQAAETCRLEKSEDCCVDNGTGDKKSSKTKTLQANLSKKNTKMRPATSSVESFDKKIKNLIERSLKVVANIRDMIDEGISPPDGEEDFFRRTKRLQEFSSRFSRIYIYPLLRQTDELSMPEKMGTSVINQKFLYAQQIVLQALQAYYAHLPSSVGKCGTDKLRTLLDQIIYMCNLYGLLKSDSENENNEFINALRSHVEILLESINNFDMKFTQKKPKSNETVKKKAKPAGSKSSSGHGNKNKSKLSMYVTSPFKKDLEHRRAVEALGKKKPCVKSKYKTAGFKHRPPVDKKVEKAPSKIKFFHKGSSQLLKSPPRKEPIREDDIKTMMEVASEFEAPPNTRENLNHENSIASNRQQLVQDSDRGTNDELEDDKVEKALEILRNFFGNTAENKQTDFLEKIANEVDKKKGERGSTQEKTDKPKKKLKEPIVTVTGAKNAKLICIRDDNSVIEDDDKRDKEVMTDVEIKLASSETQTDVRDEKRVRSRSAIKISRLPKTHRKMLPLLPKDYSINIIQYKLRCHHFRKHNPMYRKSKNIQPWELMGWISDEILDHILRSVTGELEVNEILENLYNAEFQY